MERCRVHYQRPEGPSVCLSNAELLDNDFRTPLMRVKTRAALTGRPSMHHDRAAGPGITFVCVS